MSENIIDNLIEEGRRMAENETEADILAEMRIFKCRNLSTGELEECTAISKYIANRIEAAHKRELDALKQRCAELNAEVAAKDEVIKRLNDAIAEEQRRKMTTAEKTSSVGNAAKLHEAVGCILKYADSVACRDHDEHTRHYIDQIRKWAQSALAEPVRNCDKVKDHSDAIGKFEKWMDFSPKTADEQDDFFKEHWFEFAMWLIDMNESEAVK